MSETFAIVTTSVANPEDGRAIACALVERKLAACVQIMPVRSIYRWDGAVEDAQEHLLVCKIRQADFAMVEAAISALHPYDVPEIVAVSATNISDAYAAWLMEATAR